MKQILNMTSGRTIPFPTSTAGLITIANVQNGYGIYRNVSGANVVLSSDNGITPVTPTGGGFVIVDLSLDSIFLYDVNIVGGWNPIAFHGFTGSTSFPHFVTLIVNNNLGGNLQFLDGATSQLVFNAPPNIYFTPGGIDVFRFQVGFYNGDIRIYLVDYQLDIGNSYAEQRTDVVIVPGFANDLTPDLRLLSNGGNACNIPDSCFDLTLSAAPLMLMNPVNRGNVRKFYVRVRQDNVGGRTLLFDTMYHFSDSLPVNSISTDPNKYDYYGFTFCDIATNHKWDYTSEVVGFTQT